MSIESLKKATRPKKLGDLKTKPVPAPKPEPVEPPQAPIQPPEALFPVESTLPQVDLPKERSEEAQQAVAEAYSMPYEPPTFDMGVAMRSPEQELAARELCRRRLLPFIQRFRPKYSAGWVHADICRRLERFVQQVEEGKEPRLLLMCPPRSGKSEIGSRHLAPWILGKHPEWEIIAGSHTSSLSMSFSRYIRDLLRDPAYRAVFPEGILDPSSQSTENWNLTNGGGYLAAGVGTGITGRGCLAPYTRVDTSRGKIRIIDLKVGDSVYGYDHEQGKVVATHVKALQITERSRPLLDCGPTRLTTDHRIYNAARGFYTRAGESPSLLGLRRQEGSARCDVQSVLFESADRSDHSAQMRLLWEELYAQRSGASEVSRQTREGCTGVLQSPVLRHLQDRQSCGVQQGEGGVSALSQTCHRDGSFEVLQQGMLQRVQGFETTDGCVQWRVLDPEKTGSTAGQEVPAVRYDPRSVRGASHQPRRNGQPDFESGTAVYSVPPQISSVHGSCAAGIAGLFEPFDFVVDIQTETSNFFTEGLLVHNCHVLLLDDLVKDIEAADSTTIRENTWEWYLSTAYTRLAPGGGVIGIMCMTGDTQVMLADGSQKRLDTLKPSDEIATYENGRLTTSRVAAHRCVGGDNVLKITMSSGRILRANGKHPFLTLTNSGELVWTRARALTTTHRIVVVPDNGVSTKVSLARSTGVRHQLSAEECVTSTTPRKNGPTATDHLRTTLNAFATAISNIAMASLRLSTKFFSKSRTGSVPCVKKTGEKVATQTSGSTPLLLTTVTKQEKYEDCFVTTAMQRLDTLLLTKSHVLLHDTSDFMLENVVSVELDGYEDVYDVQIDRTENFIANGAVSRNTWWHDDDWAGRIQQTMASGDGDKFEIVRYPAINEYGNEFILEDDTIVEIHPDAPVPEGARMTRPIGTAIHPERYSTEAMLRIKRNLVAGGQKRIWDALYQQNPMPDEGNFFTKDMFRYYGTMPARGDLFVYQAWDFAITEGKESDYTVGITIGQDHRDNLYVLDVRRFKSGDQFILIDSIIDFAQLWGADLIGFEDGQIWKVLEAQFSRTCETKRFYPSYEVLKPLTDKMVRANPLRGRMQLHKVFFDKHAGYFTDLQKELLHFPAGKHDDQVDSLAWAVRLTLSRAAPRVKEPPKVKSWKDKLLVTKRGASHMCS